MMHTVIPRTTLKNKKGRPRKAKAILRKKEQS